MSGYRIAQPVAKLKACQPTSAPLQDSLKPTLRRDWNCPWVKRDGRGLKKVMRALGVEAPVVHPVATSKQHFYRSE